VSAAGPLRVLVVNEAVLGHTSALSQLTDRLAQRPDLEVTLATVPPPGRVTARLLIRWQRAGDADLHLLRWRLRWSWETRRLLAAHRDRVDAALVHTQACGSLSIGLMRKLPCVLSVDATVRQYMALGYYRAHDRATPAVTAMVAALETRALRAAAGVMAWTRWNRDGLVAEHGLDAGRVEVIHPGLETAWWAQRTEPRTASGQLRILFVGNDVARKGLGLLREAARRLQGAEIDVVTGDEDVPAGDGVRVHRGVTPRSDDLRRLYNRADVFVLPTYADAVPNVVLEAMAAGLPVVATDVGAVREMVGAAGVVVPPGDAEALAVALDELHGDPARRAALGETAREQVRRHYEASTQADRLAHWLHGLVGARRPRC
jgi:glycosyltransferase involved in cell wall biosynthesis